MTALPKLTTLEADVLAGVYASNYADGRCPNVWSWSIEPRICEMKQRKGVVSSLNKKGVVCSEGSGDEAAMLVTPMGAEIAEAYGFYSDEEGYSKEAHITFVEAKTADKKITMVNSDKGILTPVSNLQIVEDKVAILNSWIDLEAKKPANLVKAAGIDLDAKTSRKAEGKRQHKATNQVGSQSKPEVEAKVSVMLGYGIVEVLQLDDASNIKDYGLSIDFSKKSFITVTGTRSALAYFADCCQNRISSQFDQPLWYMSSADATVKKIRAALEVK
jgi:hypothetical protein